jgi:hypothetical protein
MPLATSTTEMPAIRRLDEKVQTGAEAQKNPCDLGRLEIDEPHAA